MDRDGLRDRVSRYAEKKTGTAIAWSVLLLIVGLWFVTHPGATYLVVALAIGLAMVAGGAGYIGVQIRSAMRQESDFSFWRMLPGLALFVFGWVVVLHTKGFMNFIGVVIGFMMILDGVHYFLEMRTLLALGDPRGRLCLPNGVVLMVLGLLVVTNPFGSQTLLLRLIGVFMIYEAVSSLVFGLLVRRFARRTIDEVSEAANIFEDALAGRDHYDENGQEIIDATATEEDVP